MSTAQALLAALPSAPVGSSRSGDARNTDDGSSFRDALDSASRSNDPATQETDAKVSRKRVADKPSSRDEDRNVARDVDETENDEPTSRRTDQTSTAWAPLLAALNGGSSDGNGKLDLAAALERARSQGLTGSAFGALGSGTIDAAGAAMPGLVGDDGETVDVAALLALLNSGADAALEAGEAPGVDAGASLDGMVVEEIKTTIIAQETHLALEPAPSEIMARLLEQGHEAGSGDAEAGLLKPVEANNQAAAKIVAGDALEAGNRPPVAQAQDGRTQASARGGWQDAVSTETVGAGSARGAQSGTGQQSQSNGQGGNTQGSAVFAALVGAGPRAAAMASNTGDDFEGHVPVGDQIAAQVRAEIGADGLGERSSDGVVKVLQIELKPANLGSVTVRIALKDNTVTLHLEAQRHETLAAIERDRDALAGALSSAGYTVEGITAAPQGDGARSNATFAAGGLGSDASAAGQQNAGQSLANSSSGQRESGQSAAQGSASRSQSAGKDAGTNAARRDADGLYV